MKPDSKEEGVVQTLFGNQLERCAEFARPFLKVVWLIGPGAEIKHAPRTSFAAPEHQTVGRQFINHDFPPVRVDKKTSEIGPIAESFEGAVELDFLACYSLSLGSGNVKKPGPQL